MSHEIYSLNWRTVHGNHGRGANPYPLTNETHNPTLYSWHDFPYRRDPTGLPLQTWNFLPQKLNPLNKSNNGN